MLTIRSSVLMFLALTLLGQQVSPAIDQPHAGDRVVTGKGAPGSAPLNVYEVIGSRRNFLGKSESVDQQGFYAVAVNPILTKDQKIIVVDSQGNESSVATVITKSGPAGPGD